MFLPTVHGVLIKKPAAWVSFYMALKEFFKSVCHLVNVIPPELQFGFLASVPINSKLWQQRACVHLSFPVKLYVIKCQGLSRAQKKSAGILSFEPLIHVMANFMST